MKGEKPKPDPSVQHVIEEYRKRVKIMPGGKVLLSHSTCLKHDLRNLLFYTYREIS
jgi:enoyl-CoA hydratase/3-hydroxyacyl-CoA dehydrogenase